MNERTPYLIETIAFKILPFRRRVHLFLLDDGVHLRPEVTYTEDIRHIFHIRPLFE